MKIALLIFIILLPLTAHAQITEYNDVEQIKKVICKKYDELTTVQFDSFFKDFFAILNEIEIITDVKAPNKDDHYPYSDFHTVRIDRERFSVDKNIYIKYDYHCKDGKVLFADDYAEYVYERHIFGFGTILVGNEIASNIPKGKIKYESLILPILSNIDYAKHGIPTINQNKVKHYTTFIIIVDFETIE